jgi:hypothetical protein
MSEKIFSPVPQKIKREINYTTEIKILQMSEDLELDFEIFQFNLISNSQDHEIRSEILSILKNGNSIKNNNLKSKILACPPRISNSPEKKYNLI